VDISGNKLLANNYYDKSIWKFTVTQSPVVSFIDSSGFFRPSMMPCAMVGNAFFSVDNSHTDSSHIQVNGAVSFSLPGATVVMYVDSSNDLWLGTSANYLYRNNGSGLTQFKITGPTINDIERIRAAKNGTIWLTPPITAQNTPWWQGVVSFDGKT